ncbi:MAG: formyl transferase [Acidobacteriia bacterium]|nr:formyl transferase [Terriglobia bacterium]
MSTLSGVSTPPRETADGTSAQIPRSPQQRTEPVTIEFLTQNDAMYVLPFFEEFFRNYASEFRISRVLFSPVMGKRTRRQMATELLALYGPVGIVRLLGRAGAYRCLSVLPKGPSARRYYSLQQLCRAYGVPCDSIGNPNAAEIVAGIKTRQPDLLVSVACPYILKDALLSVPPLGCINIHHAPLPRYKGMMPTFWQMFHGERQVGVTVHYMAAKVDEGAALLQDKLDIAPSETLDSLIRRAKRHGAHCMARVLRDVAAGRQQPIQLDQSAGNYLTFPNAEQIREFRAKGLKAI